jgi:hypothetical protein
MDKKELFGNQAICRVTGPATRKKEGEFLLGEPSATQ